MKHLRALLFILLVSVWSLSLTGCSGGPSGDAWRYDPGIPVQVTGVSAESGNQLVTLSWSGNPVATSYNIYYVSELTAGTVTKANGTKINVNETSYVITGLDNNIRYLFMVTAVNRDGEGVGSAQVAAAPGGFSNADLTGTWYFHTLVTGPNAGWQRGTIIVDSANNASYSAFEDSSGNTGLPQGFVLTMNGNGELSQAGGGAWLQFHGIVGSRKNMMVATSSPTATSRALTIFQKKRSVDDYSTADISGTGSDQNSNDANLQGNGPTRFTYHQLYSGGNTEWEYSNAKLGQHGTWQEQYKDAIYWDFSTPTFKVVTFDFLWKASSYGISNDGLVTEYWNFTTVADPAVSPTFNNLVPKYPHDVLFTGRMTSDKTVIVGVGTRTDVHGANPQYFMRIIQLCFIPTDQALPKPTLDNLAGTYKFHRISSTGASGTATWAYGLMTVASSGSTSFPSYSDSTGNNQLSDTFTLSYYADPNPDNKIYLDFANFTTPAAGGASHYYDGAGVRLHNYYDFTSTGTNINNPASWRLESISPYYYNEHGSLSYTRDLFVMTRTDSSGNSLIVGLK